PRAGPRSSGNGRLRRPSLLVRQQAKRPAENLVLGPRWLCHLGKTSGGRQLRDSIRRARFGRIGDHYRRARSAAERHRSDKRYAAQTLPPKRPLKHSYLLVFWLGTSAVSGYAVNTIVPPIDPKALPKDVKTLQKIIGDLCEQLQHESSEK